MSRTADLFEDVITSDTEIDLFDAFHKGTKDTKGSVILDPAEIINNPGGATPPTNTKTPEDEKREEEKRLLAIQQQEKLDKLAAEAFEKNKGSQSSSAANDKSTEDNDEPNAFKVAYQIMVDAGIWEEDETFDGTEEKFLELREKNAEQPIQEGIENFLTQAFKLNGDGLAYGKKFLQHLAMGGGIHDFVIANQANTIPIDDLDNDDEKVAEAAAETLLRSYYGMLKWNDERINSVINTKRQKGLLISEAKDSLEPFKEMSAEYDKEIQLTLQQEENKRKEKSRKFTTDLVSIIETGKAVVTEVLPADKKERQKLKDYMFSPAVEMDGKKVSQYYADLRAVREDPEWTVFLALAYQKFDNHRKNKDKPANQQQQQGKKSSLSEFLESTLTRSSAASKGANSANLENQQTSKNSWEFD